MFIDLAALAIKLAVGASPDDQRTGYDFEQVCGAAQAALRISRVVSDVVRAYSVAGGRYG